MGQKMIQSRLGQHVILSFSLTFNEIHWQLLLSIGFLRNRLYFQRLVIRALLKNYCNAILLDPSTCNQDLNFVMPGSIQSSTKHQHSLTSSTRIDYGNLTPVPKAGSHLFCVLLHSHSRPTLRGHLPHLGFFNRGTFMDDQFARVLYNDL